jgi:hypothetical protein
MNHAVFPLVAALLVTTAAASAQGGHAHVHGVATMHATLEGDTLELELISPLDNLLGFEHQPRDDRQRKQLKAMADRFRTPQTLFAPTAAARCSAGPAELTSPLTGNGATTAGHKDHASHAELEAVIRFRCESPAALKDLEVSVFDAFPGIRRLDVQMAGPRGQSAATLTARQRRLSW